MNPKLYFSGLILSALISSASASTVAEYLFASGSALNTATASPIVSSSFSTTYASQAGFSSSSGNAYTFADVIDSSIASSITSGEYWSFSVNPNGETLNFQSLDFTQIAINAKAASGTYFRVAVFSSLTGFTDGAELATFNLTQTAIGTYTAERSIGLSAISALQNVTSQTEFRFYFATDMNYSPSAQTNGNMRLDNVILAATAAIPEPSNYALILGWVPMVAICLRRNRSRRV